MATTTFGAGRPTSSAAKAPAAAVVPHLSVVAERITRGDEADFSGEMAAEPAGPVERGLVRVRDRLIRKKNPDGSVEGS